jgi:ribosome-associated protein
VVSLSPHQQGLIALAHLSLVEAIVSLPPDAARQAPSSGSLLDAVLASLDDAKAEDVVSLDLGGKSSLADHMIVATGRSDRHVGSIADRVANDLKLKGFPGVRMEGQGTCEWVLIDAGDIIIHVFKPDARTFYNLERLWGADRPKETLPG